MNRNIPKWALRKAGPEDRSDVRAAITKGLESIVWPDTAYLRSWTNQRGWPAPFVGFRGKFIRRMLSNNESYYQALNGTGIEIYIPVKRYEITEKYLRELDGLYESRGSEGRPDCWGALVEALREIRRACEAGVEVKVEDTTLNSGNFYTWAHGRYHMLEDGYDKWIGDDS